MTITRPIAIVALLFIAIVSITVPSSKQLLAEEDPCLACGRRKIKMCSEECALVPPPMVRECQYQCLTQYCEHRCTNQDGTSHVEELRKLFTEKCNECKEEQFTFCEKGCLPGSPFQVALCQIKCATERCDKLCEEK